MSRRERQQGAEDRAAANAVDAAARDAALRGALTPTAEDVQLAAHWQGREISVQDAQRALDRSRSATVHGRFG